MRPAWKTDPELLRFLVDEGLAHATETLTILLRVINNTLRTRDQRDQKIQEAKDVSVRCMQENFGDHEVN